MHTRRPSIFCPLWLVWCLSLVLLLGGLTPAQAIFEERTATDLPAVKSDSYNFASLDVNGDGRPDLVVAQTGQARLLVNQGDGSFSDQTSAHLPLLQGTTTLAVAAGNVDGDGDTDLVLATTTGIRLLINDGTGVFTDQSSTRLPALPPQLSMAVVLVDVNRDGALDLVVANRNSQNRLLLNNGSGVFQDVSSTALPSKADPSYAVVAFDADQDGFADLFIANESGQDRLLLNNRQGQFVDETAARLPAGLRRTHDAVAVDVEEDGDLDLVLAAGEEGVRLLLNDGSGHFTESSGRLPVLNDFSIKIAAGDVNFDGSVDLVVANAAQDRVLLNDGSGKFTDATATWLPSDNSRSFGLLLKDLNNDRTLDLVIATPQAQDRLLRNILAYPRILLSLTPAYLEVGNTAFFTVDAFDENGLAGTSLVVKRPNNSQDTVPLSSGIGSYIIPSVGDFAAVATATDTLGNTGSSTLHFKAFAADTTAPQVTLNIAAPSPLLLGQSVTLTVTASDDRTVVATRLTVNGVPLALDRNGQAVYTTSALGLHTVVAEAQDAAGNIGRQSDSFTVGPDNQAPVVTIAATPNPVDLTKPVTITVTSSDNVRVASLNATLSGPGLPAGGQPLALDASGHGSYTPYQPGTYTITATARDPSGNETVQTATFEAVGVPDTTPPQVSLWATPGAVTLGNPVTLTVSASDNVAVTVVSLTINGIVIALDQAGKAVYLPPALGSYTTIARARDPSGNEGTAVTTFKAVDPTADTEPPVVAFSAPAEGAELVEPTSLVGTVTDDSLVQYTLAYAPVGSSDFTVFTTGTTEVRNSALGTFNPSLLLNGVYRIRLSAVDINGRTASTERDYTVAGEAKPGVLELSFTDMVVPVAGIPITVVRNYDSRIKTRQDFGVGWTLEMKQGSYKNNRRPGDGWQILPDNDFFRTPCSISKETKFHVTTIRFTDREFYQFTLRVNMSGFGSVIFGGCIGNVEFVPTGGLRGARLAIIGSNAVFWQNGSNHLTYDLGDERFGEVWEPSDVQLTTAEGRVFDLNLSAGLTRLQDQNGNNLFINANGIVHSGGKSIAIQRDAQGRISRITDPAGNAMRYEYDAAGDLTAATNPLNKTTRYVYSTTFPHHLVTIIDPNGQETAALSYDAAGRLEQACDSAGACNRVARDLIGRIETQTDATGRPTTFTYDSRGNVLSQTDALGNTYTFEYDQFNNVIATTNPLGYTTRQEWDSQGNLLRVIAPYEPGANPADYTTTFTYNAQNQPLTQTLPSGARLVNDYDTAGNLTSVRDEQGNRLLAYSYSPRGQILAETDRFGTINFTYESDGDLKSYTDSEGLTATFTSDTVGNILTMTTAEGTANFSYDALGREKTANFPSGVALAYDYDLGNAWTTVQGPTIPRIERQFTPTGRTSRIAQADGAVETFVYDGADRLLRQVDPLNRVTQYGYDAAGRLTSITQPDGGVEAYVLDATGQIRASTNAVGEKTNFSYLPDGRLNSVTDNAGQVWSFSYTPTQVTVKDPLQRVSTAKLTPQGLLESTEDADGARQRWTYLLTSPLEDAEDFPLSFTDAGGRTHSFGYDALGRLSSSSDLGGATARYEYDASGLRSMTDAAGEVTRFTRDSLGDITTVSYGDGVGKSISYGADRQPATVTLASGQSKQFDYDAAGRLAAEIRSTGERFSYAWNLDGTLQTATDAAGVTRFNYTPIGSLAGITGGNGELTYERDLSGRVTAIRATAGGAEYTTRYTYDRAGNLATVTDPLGGVTALEYDAVRRLTRRTLPNGIYTVYGYDQRDQVIILTHHRPDGAFIASFAYDRLAGGEPHRITREDGSYVILSYDNALRLTGENYYRADNSLQTALSYSYDAAGNRLQRSVDGESRTYSYGAGHRLLGSQAASGNETYGYDADGRIDAIARASGNYALGYTMDGQLQEASSAAGTIDYRYDALGQRVEAVGSSGSRRFLLGPERGEGLDVPHLIVNGAGGLQAGYAYAHGQPLLRFGAGGPVYYLTDAQGSVIGLTDAGGQATARFDYDGFGRLRGIQGADLMPGGGDFRFHGQWLEQATGFYYLRARDYDPESSRFLAPDPAEPDLREPESLNRYLFANANPFVYTDPSGRFTLISVSININISSTLRSIAINTARDYIMDEVKGITGRLLVRFVATALNLSEFQPFGKGIKPWEAGRRFEMEIRNVICSYLPDGARQTLWLEPSITAGGEPVANGLSCNQRSQFRAGSTPRPDFVVSDTPPAQLPHDRRKKAHLIGEIKLSIKSFYNAYKNGGRQPNQLSAIANFAKKYVYARIAVLASFFKGSDTERAGLVKEVLEEAASKGVIIIVFSIQ